MGNQHHKSLKGERVFRANNRNYSKQDLELIDASQNTKVKRKRANSLTKGDSNNLGMNVIT